jgi:hypothetical protein
MSCPCGLTKEEVIDLDRRDRVHLIGGKCQNPLADGSDGVCGKALGAHTSSQGCSHVLFFLFSISDFNFAFLFQGQLEVWQNLAS